tara:strand:- start:6090 stop:7580 length:1491 start_codon:yes stop_codon:yes gene_type:complete
MQYLKNKSEVLGLFFIACFMFLFACDKSDDDIEVSTVYEGNVYITNQTELEEFASYGYKKLDGHLKITGVDSLTSLMELNEVFTLEIFNTQLSSLEGLNKLKVTGEDAFNEEIKDSQIIIRNNNALGVLDGLNIIVLDHLIIRNNVNLYNFCALKDVEISGFYNVEENWLNPTLNELKNTGTCQKEIYANPNCKEAYTRKRFSGDITIATEQELIEFGNLKYTDIEGTITVSGVNSLAPIENLIVIHELVIKNTELKNLDDLKCLAIVNSLQLFDNPLLENLKGLSNTEISQPNVYFRDDIIEFENESGFLVISNNDALVNLEGLEKIEYLKTVLIENNNALISMKGLSNLLVISNPGRDCEYVNGDFLKIINNNSLLSLEGLEKMSVLHLYIHDNDNLQDLIGLSKISRLEWLSVKDNKNITSLNGLNSINEIVNYYDCWAHPGTTILTNNLSLTDFCVLKDVDFDYPLPDNYQVSGNAYNPTLAQLKTNDGCSN